MTNKYAIRITNYYCGSNGSESCSYYHPCNNKVLLFDIEEDAQDFINGNNICPPPDQAEVVEYIQITLNKKELIDFIGKANDQLVLQDIVKQFCKSINLELEITYKYALYLNFVNRNNDVVKKHNQLYSKNNTVVLFDTPEKAKVIADFIYDDTDDTWADVVPYQRIIKYDDTTIVYDIYERQDY
jgi:hypothetical protein